MIAALLTEINKPLVLTEATPRDLAPGQVLVRVLTSGICGAQLQELRGEKGTHFPRFMGHEGCGIVEQAGPGVTKVKDGDKVVMHWRKGSGMESRSPTYVVDGKPITSGQVTTFSEFSVCSENRLTVVPHDTPNELASLLGCGLSTALGVMENEAKLKAGESVLIVGCGGVGLNLIRVARMMGASVCGIDKSEEKEDLALGLGANLYKLATHYDVVVDTTGDPNSISNTVGLLGSSGRYIMVGQPPSNSTVNLFNARHLFDGEGKRIIATQGGQFNPDKDIPRYLAMWKSGHLRIDGIVTHRIPFAQINEAIELVKSGNAGRVVLEMV